MHFHTALEELVERALVEDIGLRDITTEATVPADSRCLAKLIAKEPGVLSGIEAFHMAFMLMDAEVTHWEAREDASKLEVGNVVAEFHGHTARCSRRSGRR